MRKLIPPEITVAVLYIFNMKIVNDEATLLIVR